MLHWLTNAFGISVTLKIAVERTMNEQAKNLKTAQETQREAIDAAMRKQQEDIRKAQEQARKRAP